MKTGNTRLPPLHAPEAAGASMEPGHEDREYGDMPSTSSSTVSASMEPGHEDREYWPYFGAKTRAAKSLNGARS